MKGTCYGGILHLPDHPKADMHGLVRACIRVKSWLETESVFLRLGISMPPFPLRFNLWQESESAVEDQATEREYGRLLVCRIEEQYLRVEAYEPILPPKSLEKRRSGIGLCRTAIV